MGPGGNVGKVVVAVGTRPEAIKMAPVVLALRETPGMRVTVCASGQHRELATEALAMFGLFADVDLAIMRPGQTLEHVTSACLERCDRVFAEAAPDVVLVHGDTTTAMAMALASFYRQVPVAHVEAGLRTDDRYSPFPEEMNRRLIAELASLHFAPTIRAAENLARQGVSPGSVFVTGNTGIDALYWMQRSAPSVPWLDAVTAGRALVLLTVHRRENHGEPLRRILGAVRALAERHPEALFVFPVHPNPKVVSEAEASFRGVANVRTVEPVDYRTMAALLDRCRFLLTDSGGLQEEGIAAGKPVLVLRESTERPEAVECGGARLVGADAAAIFQVGSALLEPSSSLLARMSGVPCPFGDGGASGRIARHIAQFLRLEASQYENLSRTAARDRSSGVAVASGRTQQRQGSGERPVRATV